MLEQGKSVRRKEQQRQHEMSIHNPHSLLPCATGRVKVVQIRNEAEPVKKEGLAGAMCFKSWFYFSVPYYAVLVIK